jgi:hypothetical protein
VAQLCVRYCKGEHGPERQLQWHEFLNSNLALAK